MPGPYENDRVLIVDDEVDFAELVAHRLKKAGLKADVLGTAHRVMEKAAANNYGLFILDVMLPGMKGLELCRLLRNEWRTRRAGILILSALGGQLDRQDVLDAGADDYLPKPVSLSELERRVASLLERRPSSGPFLSFPRFGLDLVQDQLYIGDRVVPLEPDEAVLMKALMFLACERSLSMDRLISLLWAFDLPLGQKEVEKLVAGLSHKTAEVGLNQPLVRWDRNQGLCCDPA